MMGALLLQIFLFCLPWPLRRRALGLAFGYDIAPDARIGFSLLRVGACRLASGARIGHLTLIKGLSRLQIGEDASLGNLNWVTGFPQSDAVHFRHVTDRDPALVLEAHAAITSRHLIDCTDRVTIGAFATFAGFRSQILTHAIDFRSSRQSCAPVSIGRYCFVGTGCILLKGSVLPDQSILAAGSVLNRPMTEPGLLYGGTPAVPLRPVNAGGYFTRQRGFVD